MQLTTKADCDLTLYNDLLINPQSKRWESKFDSFLEQIRSDSKYIYTKCKELILIRQCKTDLVTRVHNPNVRNHRHLRQKQTQMFRKNNWWSSSPNAINQKKAYSKGLYLIDFKQLWFILIIIRCLKIWSQVLNSKHKRHSQWKYNWDCKCNKSKESLLLKASIGMG